MTTRPITLGEFIRRHRARVGLTQRELAARVGCSHVQIGHVERGEQTGRRWWAAIERALGLDEGEIAAVAASAALDEPRRFRPFNLSDGERAFAVAFLRAADEGAISDEGLAALWHTLERA